LGNGSPSLRALPPTGSSPITMQNNTRKGIRVTVDEAAAWDMLAILTIKLQRLSRKKSVEESFFRLVGEIETALGPKDYIHILYSNEYVALCDANEALFDGVEKVRHGEGMSAKEFDDLNQARHRAKQALQKRFWNNELTEVKT